ncbi:MAG TPA: hypothetical protein VNW94_30455 [Streptosporangiaceae bacterium]|nr:hypothetical protein [Streptosporangiaceae bacterium]
MGRHNRFMEENFEAQAGSSDGFEPGPQVEPSLDPVRPAGGRLRWIGRAPLLPLVAGVLAIGVVGTAMSTSQISLNFAGTTPPQCAASTCDTPLDQGRGTPQASRGTTRARVVTVVFTTVARSAGTFRGTAKISNHGAKILKGKVLVFRIPGARVLSVLSGGTLITGGQLAYVRIGSIAPGQTVRVVFSAKGLIGTPAGCNFNGAVCGS